MEGGDLKAHDRFSLEEPEGAQLPEGGPLPDSNQLAPPEGGTAVFGATGPSCLEAEHAEHRIQQAESGNARARELQPSVPLDPSTGELIMQKAASSRRRLKTCKPEQPPASD